MNEREVLKPCPFCQGTAMFVERATLCDAYVMCNDCGAHGPTECQESDDEDVPGEKAARSAWNRRALLARPEGGRDGMVLVPADATTEQVQIIFNWIMGDEEIDPKTGGWWGGTEDVAKAREFYRLLIRAASPSAETGGGRDG